MFRRNYRDLPESPSNDGSEFGNIDFNGRANFEDQSGESLSWG